MKKKEEYKASNKTQIDLDFNKEINEEHLDCDEKKDNINIIEMDTRKEIYEKILNRTME